MYDLYHENEPRTSSYVQWLADERFDGDVDKVIERATTTRTPTSNETICMSSCWERNGDPKPSTRTHG